MRICFLILSILAIVLVSCNKSASPPRNSESTEKQRLANEVRLKTAILLKQNANLCPCGTMGQMLNKIEILGLSFYYYKSIDIVEGRKILINAVDTMIREINEEKKIHPFLSQYPFTEWNVDIKIFLWNPDGTDVPLGSLCLVEANEGNLYYKVHHPQTQKLTTFYKETYEEALQRIADPSLPLVSQQENKGKYN